MSGEKCPCDYGSIGCPKHPGPCKVPPPGWRCTRIDGHDGPCAAVPVRTKRKAKP